MYAISMKKEIQNPIFPIRNFFFTRMLKKTVAVNEFVVKISLS